MKERCLVIPAIKKNAIIPDQLVKKLAGETLIVRALNTARAVCQGEDIIVLTDSQEISLICERAGVRFRKNQALRFSSKDILHEMRELLLELAQSYRYCIVYRASCPLVTWVDIEEAWKSFLKNGAKSLITVKKVHQRVLNLHQGNLEYLLEDKERPLVVETKAFIMVDLAYFAKGNLGPTPPSVMPYFLEERGIEISGYQDWWICEHLLKRRHIIFVVAGFPAIGMGHVYRALMLAHEITSHKITFVCTKASELAVENIALRDYPIIRQQNEELHETVLKLRPDLVINDFLNTPLSYMQALREHGIRCVNFEDDGEGASLASLVINALYEEKASFKNYHCGPKYFCLRDEFLEASRNPLRPCVKTLLITFGGTDQYDCSRRILDLVEPICRVQNLAIRLVTGPGYAHLASMTEHIRKLNNPLLTFTSATNVMSKMMEGADLAICSAGRTVYELAHMRIPALVLAHHEREAKHTFARARHGFAFLGLMQKVSDETIRRVFQAMLRQENRARFWKRQNALDFVPNKARVIRLMESLLDPDSVEKNIN